ncbi:MAG: hypothetical protein U0518_05710 [Candidatus Gracilibacteria bacterium]
MTNKTNSSNEIGTTLTGQEKAGEKIYSVDDFVENGFREQKKAQIKIGSVTCYNDLCGVEGKKWGINLNKEDSKQFYPYSSGTGVNMIISAEPDNCENTMIQCHTIKNASIIKIEG